MELQRHRKIPCPALCVHRGEPVPENWPAVRIISAVKEGEEDLPLSRELPSKSREGSSRRDRASHQGQQMSTIPRAAQRMNMIALSSRFVSRSMGRFAEERKGEREARLSIP
jgi:hypothetical protein